MIRRIREWDGTEYEVTVDADEFGNAKMRYPDGLTHVVAWDYFESIVID
jgi:hypothetical protein